MNDSDVTVSAVVQSESIDEPMPVQYEFEF